MGHRDTARLPRGRRVRNVQRGPEKVLDFWRGPGPSRVAKKHWMEGPKERERGRGPEGPSFAKRTPLPDPSGPLGPLTLRTRWRGSGYERAQRIQPRLTPTPRVQGCARGANRVRSRVRGVVGPCPHPPGVRGRTLPFGYCPSAAHCNAQYLARALTYLSFAVNIAHAHIARR